MPSFRNFCFFGLAFVYWVLFIPALAQEASAGAIRGTVAEGAGGRIGAATVVLVNAATNLRYSSTSDVTGRFAFKRLPPGDYAGRVESPGMSPQTTPHLHVDVGGTRELEFKLAVAGAKESITVTGEPPLVETQPSGISPLIDERAINELPLNGRRFTDLALLTPGVTQDARGLTLGLKRRSGLRGHPSLPVQLPGRRRRQQQCDANLDGNTTNDRLLRHVTQLRSVNLTMPPPTCG